MHGELGAPEEDPTSLISVADRITVTVTEFSNTTSITDRWRNKEDRALGSSDRGELMNLVRFGVGISSRFRDTGVTLAKRDAKHDGASKNRELEEFSDEGSNSDRRAKGGYGQVHLGKESVMEVAAQPTDAETTP
ncbi:hypothetical protein GQ457_02G038880 [Hibiscus cannabinus]